LVANDDFEEFQRRRKAVTDTVKAAEKTRLPESLIASHAVAAGTTVECALRRPEVHYKDVAGWLPPLSPELGERVAIEIKYRGYVRRQEQEIERARRDEALPIPERLEFGQLSGLSLEAREKWSRQRPRTLGAASRIPGVTPADVAILAVHLRRPQQLSA
ncbi:MAG: tRNA uridine-5-carboxymethylaminomethyl(34) synthesis enzyme MnmG, partial [Candidatus Eremiobacteraeota bacterium]|nr:tRNA uridine-5-carboxymethylaminomethyl(34) synthesis enzyme MnmG [Candidatus Eremiobacteraeota bacterium]